MSRRYFTFTKIVEWICLVVFPIVIAVWLLVRS